MVCDVSEATGGLWRTAACEKDIVASTIGRTGLDRSRGAPPELLRADGEDRLFRSCGIGTA